MRVARSSTKVVFTTRSNSMLHSTHEETHRRRILLLMVFAAPAFAAKSIITTSPLHQHQPRQPSRLRNPGARHPALRSGSRRRAVSLVTAFVVPAVLIGSCHDRSGRSSLSHWALPVLPRPVPERAAQLKRCAGCRSVCARPLPGLTTPSSTRLIAKAAGRCARWCIMWPTATPIPMFA